MGYWKDVIERLGGGNPAEYEDHYVCAECFGDHSLKDFIEGESQAKTCTFCGVESDEPIAAPIVEVLLYINECLEREYDVAENKLPYESAEGGYIGETWTTEELLGSYLELPNDDDGTLMEALCDGLGDRAWCRKYPFSLTDDERLNFSWDEFCNLVKYRRRFFFLSEKRKDDELFSPFALLKELTTWCERFELIKPLPVESAVFRARCQKPGETLTTPADLGPPQHAKMSNRMSPPGIVMFYVSDNPETALRETAQYPCIIAIGGFITKREAMILDLADIPPIPSIFEIISDSLEYDPRPLSIFLNYFSTELSKPIARDDRVHVEYIPTQIITEYFRTEFTYNGKTLDGIRYRSARHESHCSLVLFATRADLIGVENHTIGSNTACDPWIKLCNREEQSVTQELLAQWDREAPQPVESRRWNSSLPPWVLERGRHERL